MTFVLGRTERQEQGPTGRIGRYRALDGSHGTTLEMDLDGPHAVLVVGKRGYGKSYTLGVLAEELARTRGIAPVIVDPMGVFETLAESPAASDSVQQTANSQLPTRVIPTPAVDPSTLDPRSWCELLALSPEGSVGGLVWQAARARDTLAGMCEHIEASEIAATDRRAAINHLTLAEDWGVFDSNGLDAATLATHEVTVLDVSTLDRAPMNAVVRAVADSLYRARVEETVDRLPWLLVDEVHALFDGVAGPALRRLLTRGRAPGVSLVAATQRPGSLPAVALSQSDLLVAHRLTAQRDLDALAAAQPSYANEPIESQLPTEPGEVVIIDDATETIHAARIRSRETPHGGDSPRVSDSGTRPHIR